MHCGADKTMNQTHTLTHNRNEEKYVIASWNADNLKLFEIQSISINININIEEHYINTIEIIKQRAFCQLYV